ncbi:hypothetical protein OH76DRAFT_1483806 [Lentinus brumalis]|uniref:Uncharacterized protein n=1 Tax=Lentinus brumalis TaxID=2498619 RepID=A0A371D7D6_9APHY|nr:hypothetical protein OH76DRAFT_1483806 [Polyporus brumalis]
MTYSFPNVLQSHFYVGSDSSKGFTDLLRCLPQLAELNLLLYRNSDALRYGGAAVDALTRICRALSDELRGLCPKLHTSRVQIISATPTSPAYLGDLKRVLRARTSCGHPNRSLAVQEYKYNASPVEMRNQERADHNLSTVYAQHLASLLDEFQFYAPEYRPFPPRKSE